MADKVTNYQCPACTGPLHFDSATGKLVCDYCGSAYEVADIEAQYAAKQKKADSAAEADQKKAARRKAAAPVWDEMEAASLTSYTCTTCGAELVCDATTAATNCPYCGNPTVLGGKLSGKLKPEYIIPFRMDKKSAIEILKKNNKKFQFPVEWGVDIQTEHERYLTEVVFKKPVFVTDYPKEIKSFYMKQNPDGKTVAAADMLVPGIGELIGGSQREEDYDKLVTRMDELGLDKSSYDWYLNLRKFGGVEHAGYGLGFERMIMYLTGIQNIRDVLPFPRTAYGF